METTLRLPFLVEVKIPPGLGGVDEGLSRDEVACLGCVFFEVTEKNLGKVTRFLKQHTADFDSHFDVTALESREDVLALLDAGAHKVFVKAEQLSEFSEFGSRVAPAVAGAADLSAASGHGLLLRDFDHTACDFGKFIDDCKAQKPQSL